MHQKKRLNFRRLSGAAMAIAAVAILPHVARAGGAYGTSGLAGGYRWDAAARTINGNERSLQGGLRYSVQGGSWEAYRDMFTWDSLPTVAVFQQTVEQAFSAWTAVDPASGLGTSISFIADFSTSVVGFNGGGVNSAGAEIDLLAATSAGSWGVGSSGTQGETYFAASGSTVMLTSGTTNYAAGAIAGADVKLNSNSSAVYSVDVFRLLLSHEIGHALGLADADVQAGVGGTFIDDNYDGSTSQTAFDTLNNSWASKVNTADPSASTQLHVYTVANGDPGTKTAGVNILMESEGLGGQFGNLTPLSNDDYGMRQFLYPQISGAAIPEPSALSLVVLGSVCFLRRHRRK